MSRYEFVSLICFCEKYIFILLDLLLGLIACPTYEYVQPRTGLGTAALAGTTAYVCRQLGKKLQT